MARRRAQGRKIDPVQENINAAWRVLHTHPLFAPMLYRGVEHPFRREPPPPEGWAVVYQNGIIQENPKRLAQPDEWIYIFSHCLLHLGLGHFRPQNSDTLERATVWNAACDVFIARFLADLKLGQPPDSFLHLAPIPLQTEEELFQRFLVDGVPKELQGLGTAGPNQVDMLYMPEENLYKPVYLFAQKVDYPALFGRGLGLAVSAAVSVASGAQTSLYTQDTRTLAQLARTWFINSYPLLGSLAAAFKIIEDPALCGRMSISVAAVDDEMQEIYINPAAGLDEHEMRFVLAHEMLHTGLRHQARQRGRDPYLWNVACDYVINGWLVEMGLGALPQFGALYDTELKGLSAESIYDRIVNDLRKYRKLATLRGTGLGDMLEGRPGARDLNGISLDDFYRRCLAQGLEYHQLYGRGTIPAGLVEEIRALAQPPIAWDVALARWFDDHFPPLEKLRTYARPSRRQSASPDIPRPSYTTPPGDEGRTFGVILDTSGSMDRQLLAKALGAISSYSLSRDVPLVRVVFCDAAVYDQGYLSPEDIAGRVQVKGRGGTVLQPAIDLLEKAVDFPRDGPLLIITDGWCDRLHLRREHAFLIPEGNHLPFIPRGDVFYVT